MVPKSILIVALLFFTSSLLLSTELIEFNYLRIEDGLPHSTINDFIQDSLGYIWFATDNGLACYDNYKIKVFSSEKGDSNSISNNQVYKLFIDTRKNLWVGTKHSLELFDKKRNVFKHFYIKNMPEDEKVPIIDIFQENDSILLLCTDGGGLRYINTNSYQHGFFCGEGFSKLTCTRVSSVQVDMYGRYWLGTLDDGVFIYDPDNKSRGGDSITHLLKNTEVRKIEKHNNQKFYAGTYGSGIVSIDVNSFRTEAIDLQNEKDVSARRIFDMRKSGDNLYIGTDGGGLLRFNMQSKETKCFKNSGINTRSISNNVIRTIFIDQESNLWLGHFQGGISYSITKNQFQNLKYHPYDNYSLSHTNVTSVIVDKENRTWIGTDGGGLNILENGRIYNEIYGNLSEVLIGSNPPKVLSLFQDSAGDVWIGTYLDGLFIYNNKSKKILPFEMVFPGLTLSNNDIRCITQDRKGNIWVGTNGGGINIINLKQRSISTLRRDRSQPSNSLTLDWVRCIYEDELGFIWIGTAYGVNVFDPTKGSYRHYLFNENDSTSISSDFVYSIVADCNKDIWIGTSAGLNKYNREADNFDVYTKKDGLPGDIINSVIATSECSLWLSTNKGLSYFLPDHEIFKNYNTTDGIASNSFINGAAYNLNDSMYYFGSTSGITYFNPNEIRDVDYSIPIVISGLKIFNQEISVGEEFNGRIILTRNIAYTKGIELLKSENVLTLEFTVLSYSYADKVKYEYRLLGFSDKWNTTSSKPSVTYTNLKSGDYIFEVRVSNMGRGQNIKSLDIRILPPFYETWWFRVLTGIVVLIVAIMLLRFRIKNITTQRDIIKHKYEIEKLAAEKERIELHNKMHQTEKRFKEDEVNYKNSQLISTTMLLSHNTKIMNQVKGKAQSLSKTLSDEEIKKGLKCIIESINAEFQVEKDWARFETHFNDVHKDFIKRLKEKYPDLSHTYLRLCAYLKLDLSTKEIATLMNISQRGVEKSRSRLRKKFTLSSDIKLTRFISEL